MPACPGCGVPYADLEQHWRKSPACAPPSYNELAPLPAPSDHVRQHDPLHLFEKSFSRQVIKDYNHIRFDKYVKQAFCDAWSAVFLSWIETLTTAAAQRARTAATVEESVNLFIAVIARGTAVITKYQSQEARDDYNVKVLRAPFVEPDLFHTVLTAAQRKQAAGFSFFSLLGRILQRNKQARQLIIEKSDDWQTGKYYMKRASVYTDLTDGWKCRSGPMMAPAEWQPAGKPKVVRVGVQVHRDAGTMSNPIGTKRGDHKYEITSAAIVNLPLRMRLSFDFLILLSIVCSKLDKAKGGALWNLAGRNQQGGVEFDALTSELEQGEIGFPILLPNDDDPGGDPVPYVIQLFFVVVSGDWLAAQAMGFTPESTSAEFCCGECMWVSIAAVRRQRARTAAGATAAAGASDPPEPALRTHANLLADAARLLQQNLSKTAHKAQLKALGMNKVRCVLQYIPGADVVLDKPPDAMHLYGCGISRIEGAWKLRVLFKEGAGLAISDAWEGLRENIIKCNRCLPRGKHISKLYPQTKDKKINQMHLDLNASETFYYVIHSVTLVEPLLTERGRKHPAWLSWLAHRRVVVKALQHAIADGEVDELVRLIKGHVDAFDKVEEYEELERPKFHFQKHLPAAIRRFGIPRSFWCMPFEAFLQLIKKLVMMGNFISVAETTCRLWSMKSALVMCGESTFKDRLGDVIEPSSELSNDMASMLQSSRLLQAAACAPGMGSAYAARFVRSFTREPMEVRSGDYIIAVQDDLVHVGRVGEIAEIHVPGRVLLRMLLSDARPIAFEDDTRGSVITVRRDVAVCEVYVRLEHAAVHEVSCDETDADTLTFNYLY